jgi:MHS family alpha-ketoglutarate permease-like MFS transporter
VVTVAGLPEDSGFAHRNPMTDGASESSTTMLSTADRMKAIIAGSAGNLIEWYDFYIYAFTALYFSSTFFPKSDPLVQIMATSGIFAAGFLMRPLGGWFFGRFTDRHGRQKGMVVSVLMMGVGSLLIAVLPTYAQVGVIAPALLLIGRMIQGFSTGGQYGAAATYLSEIAGPKNRGFFASFQYVTLVGGQLLATGVVLMLQNLLPEDAMKAYGWRIGFALGAVGAALILLLRNVMLETSARETRHQAAGSMRELMKHMPALLCVLGLTAGGSLSFYTFTTYMQKYLVLTAGLDKGLATSIMSAVLIPFMLMQPVFGALADRIGRRNNLILFGVLGTFLTLPLLSGLANVSSAFAAFGLVLIGLMINAFYTAVSGLFKAELFPVHVRALGVGLSYGIANALFGGTAENVALALKSAGHENYFYWYVTGLCAISLVTALLMKDSRNFSALADAKP